MTPLQLRLLKYIDTYIREHGGESPSTEQMQIALGLGSKSGVCRLTDALAAYGYIRKPKNRVRAIEVLRMPPAADSRPMPKRLTRVDIARHISKQPWCTADAATVLDSLRELRE